MTYLSFPRLNFSGKFQADPSTVNNDPYHFKDAAFVPQDQEYGPDSTRGWWNPKGSGDWRFGNCLVRSLCYDTSSTLGVYEDQPTSDPIIGKEINGSHTRVSGKLVDLDPENQMVSQIWGFQIHVGDMSSGKDAFCGDFAVAAFEDIWSNVPTGHPDSMFSAFYQSVITNVQWAEKLESQFLQKLKHLSPDTLSIKFTVNGYDDDRKSPTFTWGRVVGAIGAYVAGEPRYFVPGRLLRSKKETPPQKPFSLFNDAYCRLESDNHRLIVDFGNSFSTATPGSPLQDAGKVELGYLEGETFNKIGEIDYLSYGWYENKAGIQTFSNLTPLQVQNIAECPLCVRQANSSKYVLQEDAQGAFARADGFVFRLYPQEPQSTTLYAYRFGNPCPDATFQLNYDSFVIKQFVQQAPSLVSGPKVGIPQEGLTFPSIVKTGDNGQAIITLTGKNPLLTDLTTQKLIPARKYIDGQVYGVSYTWENMDNSQVNAFPSNILNVLVWNACEVPTEPTWLEHIRPIFHQYANLYPVMKPIVDLGDYLSVISRKDMLRQVFNMSPTHPQYMPVTRDLSHSELDARGNFQSKPQGKLAMIRQWLDPQNFDEGQPRYAPSLHINTVQDLKDALQTAIELEHATIPPYLCALYSIKSGYNQEVVDLIRSVVIEEMLHMSLACNLLNAIGGSPDINKSNFVPEYPTPLPGNLRPDLVVTLKKCSIAQIRDVFMSIEEPDITREPTELSQTETTISIRQKHLRTIGWFYDKIKTAFKDLSSGQNIFTGDFNRQLTHWYDAGAYGINRGKMIPVKDLDSALKAIAAIKKQGEGASSINPRDGYNELAHFCKFEEIVRGRSIVLNPHGNSYSFSGAEIPFDPEGVYPMIDNPITNSLPVGSGARLLSEQFNERYRNMLNVLHDVFNGHPENLQNGISLMFSLSVLGRKLMETQITGTSETAGMSFQFPSDRQKISDTTPEALTFIIGQK